ncbi:MAG: hypothetical protein AAGK14_14655 [Verrucomicrobiota bacterium]
MSDGRKQLSGWIWAGAAAAMVLAGALALTVYAWNGPTENEVRRDFLAAHPGAMVESVSHTQAEFNLIHYQIRYRDGDGLTRQTEWGYRRDPATDTWKLASRSAE